MACCIPLANVDLTLKVFYGIYLKAISQEVLMNLVCHKRSEFTPLKLLLLPPGTNELSIITGVSSGDIP